MWIIDQKERPPLAYSLQNSGLRRSGPEARTREVPRCPACATTIITFNYISVFHTPDKSDNSYCVPFVQIRHKSAHSPEARLMLNDAFDTACDASAHSFAVGKQWVDRRVTQINPATASEIATRALTPNHRQSGLGLSLGLRRCCCDLPDLFHHQPSRGSICAMIKFSDWQ
jgi:hypothetical protein